MPSVFAFFGLLITTGSPSNTMVPESGCRLPETMFISVVLPAPFSPTIRSDAERVRFFRVTDHDRFTIEHNGSRVWLQVAGDHVHQRGLTRAVLADDRVNFTRPYCQGDVTVGYLCAERFAKVPEFEDGVIHVCIPH